MGGKKVAIAGLASILVVAMVVAVAVTVTKKNADIGGNSSPSGSISTPSTSNKAVQAVCSPTEYRETCEQSLSQANTSDPKELIKLSFDVAIQNIGEVLKNSTLLQQAATDNSTKGALFVCQDVLDVAIYDLKRSIDKVGELEIAKLDDYVMDLQSWLSAVVNNQETCIDAFENTTGDTGEKMTNLMKTAREMARNSLTMVVHISSILEQLQIPTVSSSRRLLSEEEVHGEPEWARANMRRLLGARPNAVVALDGSGNFKSINAAIKSVPERSTRPFVIHVKAGLYHEYVSVPIGKNNVVLVGDGPMRTRITGNKNYVDGVKTMYTATVAIEGEDFVARDIAFENTAGPVKEQAVALRVAGERAVLFNVHMDGYQDTLYAHNYRQFYRNCRISGTVDFIFGDGNAVFQNCQFVIRNPLRSQQCMLTAQGRTTPDSAGRIVIQNGEIRATPQFLSAKPAVPAYLGRPWKMFSRTIIMNTYIGGSIQPAGWYPWKGNFALDTLYYGEYKNYGPGSNTARRVRWKGIRHITPQIAASFAPGVGYRGNGGDQWIRRAGIPYVSHL